MTKRRAATVVAVVLAGGAAGAQGIDLPTSKQMQLPVPGSPQRLNSLPMALAVSPDGRWVVSLNAGYGTFESKYEQSLAVMDTVSGAVRDFPEERTAGRAGQTFFSGVAFSADGTKVYASMASSSDPAGGAKAGDTGNGVVVYSFANGMLKAQGFLKLPLVKLAGGRHTDYPKAQENGTLAIPYPAGIAVYQPSCGRLAEKGHAVEAGATPSGSFDSASRDKAARGFAQDDKDKGGCEDSLPHLLVAENLADAVAELDAETGKIERTFDLSESETVPGTYPIAMAVTKDGRRAFVALWNASQVVELDLVAGKIARKIALMKPAAATAPGSHPYALLLDEKTEMLYVALANRDSVAGLSIGKAGAPELAVRGYFDTRLPGQSYFGAEPDALAMNADGSRLYAANMGSDAVAVLDPHKLRSMERAKGMVEPLGFVPTELMPMALVSSGGKLYVATDKGKGTGPNNMPQRTGPGVKLARDGGFTYAPTLLYGSLAALDEAALEAGLKASTEVVLESNRMKAAQATLPFPGGKSPIKHVIYIIKENRTYDQVFGDLAKDGKAVGNGDASLTMYGAAITPNQHKLALQFGVLDNFYDSGEVSGIGHVWSNAAIGTAYLEDTWQQNYRNSQRTYDWEGMVANGYPLLQHIPDVVEPASSYIWTDMAAHGRSVYHFGEYVSSTFCTEKGDPSPAALTMDPRQGAMSGGSAVCAQALIRPGQPLPEAWGGGKNLWPWPIPRLAKNTATKPELVGHFAEESPDFNLRVPDQIRVNVFLRHLAEWEKELAAGHDTMPNMIQLRLPNDHTGGTTPGGPTPRSSVADNDLAIGRAVEAISHSGFWDNTAFFILEDDAQNGADHVDAHRSLGIVVSKYAPHPQAGQAAVVDSRFYSTVSFLHTIELLLGVPPMNNNDALSSAVTTLFAGPGDQPAFTADVSNRENGLIYTANPPRAVGAAESKKMDFRHPDRADSTKLNLILWQDAMGTQPPPAMLLVKHKEKKDDDD